MSGGVAFRSSATKADRQASHTSSSGSVCNHPSVFSPTRIRCKINDQHDKGRHILAMSGHMAHPEHKASSCDSERHSGIHAHQSRFRIDGWQRESLSHNAPGYVPPLNCVDLNPAAPSEDNGFPRGGVSKGLYRLLEGKSPIHTFFRPVFCIVQREFPRAGSSS